MCIRDRDMIQRLSSVFNANFTGITEEKITPLMIRSAERAVDVYKRQVRADEDVAHRRARVRHGHRHGKDIALGGKKPAQIRHDIEAALLLKGCLLYTSRCV